MKYIILSSLSLLLVAMSFVPRSSFVITGVVQDASTGGPLASVLVTVSGTETSTVTDEKGRFSVSAEGSRVKLIFSAPGYTSVTQTVGSNSKKLVVKLQRSGMDLQEVVVTGYTTQKSFHHDEVAVDAAPMLSGRVAGVYIGPAGNKRRSERVSGYNREGYDAITENGFKLVGEDPLSTFSIDVDAASYSNVRRLLSMGQLPPTGAVRIEEMINYFRYDYKQPVKGEPFSINTAAGSCPWNEKHQLVSIGLQGKKVETDNLPSSNLVFLVDVSGSMLDENKLPLVKQSLKLLTDQLRANDRVALVVYAGNAGLVLPSTSGEEKLKIKDAIDRLEAGGSTAGGAGIQLAYKTARENLIQKGNNRIILCSDGDFNVGASSDAALEEMIEKERKSGVYLTILGYGTGNYQDAKMQKLATKGNGNHAYIDNLNEARKVLVQEFGGTLYTIAKDVKLQIEFNPAYVQAYRLVGYENRLLNKEDFNDDKKDAGELGSGHTVTALYEIIPVGVQSEFVKSVDPLKYQQKTRQATNHQGELMTVKFRYKEPGGSASKLISHTISAGQNIESANFRFAAAVAEFGMLLRNSEFKQHSSYEHAWQLAKGALGADEEGYRSELLRLIRNAQTIEKGMSAR